MIAEAVAAMAGADVVVLSLGLGNDFEGEGRDRSFLTFPEPQVTLLDAVIKAKGSSKIVLAINSAGGIDLNGTEASIDAIIQLWCVAHPRACYTQPFPLGMDAGFASPRELRNSF